MTFASAPGKIILFGEHAVVYGRPALAAPVTQVQATVTVNAAPDGIWISAPQINLQTALSDLAPEHPLAAAVHGVFTTLGISRPPSLRISIESDIPVASGLGSGAAVSVATIRALSAFFGQPLDDETVNALAYEVEKLHHGTPSGIDNTVATYRQPIYFIKGKPLERLRVGAPFTIVIGNSGVPAPTRESVGAVRRLWESNPARWEQVFDAIGELADKARYALENGDTAALGPLMDSNHALLKALTVSSPELERLVEAARSAGAWGAKLSGGGRGGNMIAIAPPHAQEQVAQALHRAGATQVILTRLEPFPAENSALCPTINKGE